MSYLNWLCVVLFVILVALILGCGGIKTEPTQTEVVDIKKQKDKEPEWASSDTTVKLGDLHIQIMEARIGKVSIKDHFRGSTSRDELLTIKLSLHNAHSTKKVEYRSWNGADFSIARDFATLKDEFGNNYKRIRFGLGTFPEGGIPANKSESIHPKKDITDVLVFELPVENATRFNLEMPALNYGGDGMVRFRVLASSISRQAGQ